MDAAVGDGHHGVSVIGAALAGVVGPWVGAWLLRRRSDWPEEMWTERGATCFYLLGCLMGGVCGGLLLALFWIPAGLVEPAASGKFLVSQMLARALGSSVLAPLLLLPRRGTLGFREGSALRIFVPRIMILISVLVLMKGVAREVGEMPALENAMAVGSSWWVPTVQSAAFALTTLLGVILMAAMGKSNRVEEGFVAAKQAAEDAREKVEVFFRVSLDLMGVAGMDGYFKRINPAFSETLGYSDEEFLSRPFVEFVHPEDVEKTIHAVEQLAGGESVIHFQNRYRDHQGRYLWLEWTAVPDSKGELIYAAARNVTEQRKAEDDLRRSNAELEQFAYVASHDLQEPLRMVTSFAQLLQRRYQGKLGEDADEYIHHVVDGTERMRRLILGLLELSRVGRKGQELKSIDSAEALKIATENLNIAIEESGVDIQIGELPVVTADLDQLARVFQNLISNAIKFGRDRDTVISIHGEWADGKWLFTVEDNGPGIATEQRDRVFQIFQRLHSRVQVPGTGMGLAICRRIISRHGGEIWIEQAELGGAAFRFTLNGERMGNGNANPPGI